MACKAENFFFRFIACTRRQMLGKEGSPANNLNHIKPTARRYPTGYGYSLGVGALKCTHKTDNLPTPPPARG